MKNRISRVVLMSLIALLLVGSNAFAAFELNSYARMWMTNAKGFEPAVSQTTFAFDEQPWLYIRFFGDAAPGDKIGGSLTSTMWTWDGGESADKSFLKFYMGNKNDIWIGFSEGYWKKNMQLAGDWTISALSLLNDKTGIGCGGNLEAFGGTVNFKVNAVPEPVSALLFLTGGAAIAAFRRKRA
ncbi:MAG TPA: PEP-CTERM sorting domain-containing protein [Candidatus Omnitrophota bacterium]|nr:PEP-CTERM sorting domain-containing protein [Candidatus Omnitrophota bacterium]